VSAGKISEINELLNFSLTTHFSVHILQGREPSIQWRQAHYGKSFSTFTPHKRLHQQRTELQAYQVLDKGSDDD
jgi:hypothetical protein